MSFSNHRATSTYRNVGLQTRTTQHDQHELVVMMFESVLESLTRARGAIEANDVAAKVLHIGKAIRVVQEGLRTSLDLENGGDLATNLANLYDYAVMRMTQANATNDPKALEEVAQLIKPLADAWRQMRTGTTAQIESDSTNAASALHTKAPPPSTRRISSAYSTSMAWAGA